MRKGEAFKGGAGILNKQSARFLFAELFGDGIVGKFDGTPYCARHWK